MSKLSIGMIETIGLAAAIEAADVCTKSANVTLIGYELSKGNGMAVVKIEGNVGAVKAAIEAATVAANKVSKVFSTKVIPRPSNSINNLIRNKDTVGYETPIEKAVKVKVPIDNKDEHSTIDEEINEDYKKVELFDEAEEIDTDTYKKGYTCNLCKDPNCKREKGDLKTTCIHYKE